MLLKRTTTTTTTYMKNATENRFKIETHFEMKLRTSKTEIEIHNFRVINQTKSISVDIVL